MPHAPRRISGTFPEILAKIRRRRGLTRAQLAEVIGTTPQKVSAYLLDRLQPNLATIQRVSSATGERLSVYVDPESPDDSSAS